MSALPAFAANLWLAGIPVLLITAAFIALLYRAPARLRYLAALGGFVAAIVVPVLLTREAAPIVVSSTMQSTTAESFDTALLVIALWLAGALFLIGRDVMAYRHLRREKLGWIPAGGLAADSSSFSVVLSAGGAPRTHGMLRPVIVLPEDLMRAEPELVRLVLAHEESHARWRDPMIHSALRLVRSMLWFALPLWFAERLVIREREAAADEAAVAAQTSDARSRYAEALVDFCRLAPQRSALAVQLGAAADLEYRIRRILRATSRAGSLASALGLLGAGFFLFAFTPLAEVPAEIVVEVDDVRAVQKLNSVASAGEVQPEIRAQIENAIEKKVRATTERSTGSAEGADLPVAEVPTAVDASGIDDVGPSPLTPLPRGEGEERSPLPANEGKEISPVAAPEIDNEVIVIRDVHRHRHVDRRDGERSEGDVKVDTGRSKHPVALFHRGVTKPVKRVLRWARGGR